MTRTTIDFGIDLGTTNSAIAVLGGVDAKVFKNVDGSETTPSAVRVDQRNRLYVGREAKERSEQDPENTCVEFKLRMGTTGRPKVFRDAGRSMEPEELSAEVLKSLKRDVESVGDEVAAAVITVPAAFELSACEATKRAAELAGLAQAPLLQEPTAAALAYGFQAEVENAFWLVYDFGGGTFDAAVVNMRDGEFNVVNHRGDNLLGGKLIDWKIVETLLIPAVVQRYGFADFTRGNPRWPAAVNTLKLAAEAAKIQLSRRESVDIDVVLVDAREQRFEFDFDLRRGDIERIAEPYIARSVDLCRRALKESGLGPGDVEKVLLVGGTTLSPYLRERIADPREGLGIAIDQSQDPLTVVAKGAAIFAGSKRLEVRPSLAKPDPGAYSVELEYSPTGPETEPFVGGRVTGPEAAGLAVEFVNAEARPAWRSGRIPLSDEGTFTATLWAERGRRNTFGIELTDASGTALGVSPDRLDYTVGAVETQPLLQQTLGVGLDGNEFLPLLPRNTPLPARRNVEMRTTVAVNRGTGEGMIRIPVMEGEHDRADRNLRIGRLVVEPNQVRRDVPEGSAVDFTIVVDESRLVVARAYVPLLDEEFEHVINMRTETVPKHEDLVRDSKAEKHRLETVRRRLTEIGDARATELLLRIDRDRLVRDVESKVEAARGDTTEAIEGGKLILVLRAAVDDIEDALEWPELVRESQELLAVVQDVVREKGNGDHRRSLSIAESSVQAARAARDAPLLRQRIEDLRTLAMRVLDESGDLPFIIFENLCAHRSDMRDPDEARDLIAAGRRAAAKGDAGTLRDINRVLADLLPDDRAGLDLLSTVRRV
ncbi:Hsp70 family protein [Actinomadura sp. NEAU-AAG7]|uniref:Hsp70 family protein n=1 Tax=Actinomadura sp. NEAU-AAG7 TaxID=2839640 RepID=UPI001BE3F950|nr:Hsp70 family protein [Actinomadura sp. NEAU-AAG7]MBT2208938.1 Hsp70 family protein [Actinomadura sp. NEAU-AAG7]